MSWPDGRRISPWLDRSRCEGETIDRCGGGRLAVLPDGSLACKGIDRGGIKAIGASQSPGRPARHELGGADDSMVACQTESETFAPTLLFRHVRHETRRRHRKHSTSTLATPLFAADSTPPLLIRSRLELCPPTVLHAYGGNAELRRPACHRTCPYSSFDRTRRPESRVTVDSATPIWFLEL